MVHAQSISRHRLARAALVAVFLLTAVIPPWLAVAPAVAAQARAEPDDSIDLAAIVLNSANLEAVGLDGFRAEGLGTFWNVNLQAYALSSDPDSQAEIRTALTEAEFRRSYGSAMARLVAESESGDLVDQRVSLRVAEFPSADNAHAALEWFVFDARPIDDDGVAADWQFEVVEAAAEVGDESVLTRYTGPDRSRADSHREGGSLTFRVDGFVVALKLDVYGGGEPNLAVLPTLAEDVIERIELAQGAAGTGLGSLILRLATETRNEPPRQYQEGYVLLDEDAERFVWEDEQTFVTRAATYGDADSSYVLTQLTAASAVPETPNPVFLSRVLVFGSDDAASAWLAETGDLDYVQSNNDRPYEAELATEELADAPTIGDESRAYTYEWTVGGAFVRGHTVLVRVGKIVAGVSLEGFTDGTYREVTATGVMELARLQVACIEAGSCAEPVLVPGDILAPAEPEPVVADGLTELWSFQRNASFTDQPMVVDGTVYVWSFGNYAYAVDAESGDLQSWAPCCDVLSGGLAVADGTLFGVYADDAFGVDRLVARDTEDEDRPELWSVELEFTYGDAEVRATKEGVVIVSVQEGEIGQDYLHAYETATGELAWRFDQVADGVHYADGIVFVTAVQDDERSRDVVALDAASGDELWRQDDRSAAQVSDGVVYTHDLQALDASTGDELCSLTLDDGNPDFANASFKLVADDTLYMSKSFGNIGQSFVVAFDIETGRPRWVSDQIDTGGFAYQVRAADGLAYIAASSELWVLDARTGKRVATFDSGHWVNGLTLDNGMIYAATSDGTLHALQLDLTPEGRHATSSIPGEDGRLDLAAMTVAPGDLEAVGLDDYAVGFGETLEFDAFVALAAESLGKPEAEVRETLEDAGFERAYFLYLYLADEPGDPESTSSRYVYSFVAEFADERGAAAAWDLLADDEDVDGADDVDGEADLGEQADVTRSSGIDPATDAEYELLDIGVQDGNLIAGVTILDFTGEEPAVEEVEAIAERLLHRIETVLDESGENRLALSDRAPRLAGEEVVPTSDNYIFRDGEAIPIWGESVEMTEWRGEEAARIDLTEAYLYSQPVATADDPDSDSAYIVQVLRFEDEVAAATWMVGAPGDAAFGAEFAWDEEVDPSFGEQAVTYLLVDDDDATQTRSLIVRVDNLVITVDVTGTGFVPAEVMSELAASAVPCLEDGCVEPIPVPTGFDVASGDLSAAGIRVPSAARVRGR